MLAFTSQAKYILRWVLCGTIAEGIEARIVIVAGLSTTRSKPELDAMHQVYRAGGGERSMAPHVVYADDSCPHDGCGRRMQAIEFRLEEFGRDVHDPLVRAWWDDRGFAGRCPSCGGWIHFTIRGKRAIAPEEAQQLPLLPDGWDATATIL